ncbi:MAG: hypothetical protein U1F18_00925 [Steroidobacteraceae bacterium]
MSAVLHLRIVEVAARTATRDVARVEARRWLFVAWTRMLRALREPALATRVAPPVPGATLPLGARVPGTSLELDPASAAGSLGLLLHQAPADPATLFATLLAAGDYAARRAHYDGVAPPTVATLLEVHARSAAIQAALAADPQVASDPWLAPRVAGAFGATALLGGDAAGCEAAALAAALDGSPPSPAALQALHGAAAEAGLAPRLAAGENAARALRHALAAATMAAPVASRVAPPVALPAAIAAGDDDSSLAAAFATAVRELFPARQASSILEFFADPAALDAVALDACLARLVRN